MKPRCWRLGLLGYPLSHSRSPELHHAALAATGLEGEYRLFSYPPTPEGMDAIAERLDALRRGELHGLNVTIPHKQNVIPLLDRLTEVASSVGAVNTLYVDSQGALTGDNTDVPGFLHDVRGLSSKEPGQVLVLGAGGSARAVVYGLARSGWRVRVLARRVDQATMLIESLRLTDRLAEQVEAGAWTLDALAGTRCDLVVNTSPLGMYPEVQGCPWPEDLPLPDSAAVYDLVYNPLETVLVSRARAAHHATRNGSGMLVAQAALAFHLWTGLEPPFEVMQSVFHS